MSKFSEFPARTLHGEGVFLSRYAGDTVLVVNTASSYGFTPQYTGIEMLYRNTQRIVSSCSVFHAINSSTRNQAMPDPSRMAASSIMESASL